MTTPKQPPSPAPMAVPPQPVPDDTAKSLSEFEWNYCPHCGGNLDTGWECLKCKRDFMPLASPAPAEQPDGSDSTSQLAVADHEGRTQCHALGGKGGDA